MWPSFLLLLLAQVPLETTVNERAPQRVSGATSATRDDLQTWNANNAADALGRMVGVDVSGSSLKRDRLEKVSLRGLDARYTLVLIDGERLVGADDGAVDLSAIPPELIERIDLYRGPQATLLGGDAIGGVINIITRKRANTRELEGMLRYGSFQSFTGALSGRSPLGPLEVNVAGRFERSDGWTDTGELDRALRQTTARSDARGTEKGTAQLTVLGRPAEGQQLSATVRLLAGLTHRDQTLARFVETGTRVGAEKALGLDGELRWKWAHPTHGIFESSARLFRHAQARDESSELALRQAGRDIGTVSRTLDESWAHWVATSTSSWKYVMERHTFTALGQLRVEHRDSTQAVRNEARDVSGLPMQLAALSEPARSYAKSELFGSLALHESVRPHRRVEWNVGARLDASDVWGAFVSPSTSLWVKGTDWLTLRGGLGRGHKMPSFDSRTRSPTPSLDANGTRWLAGNPELKPEAAWTGELGFDVLPSAQWQFAATGFYASVSDKIQKVVTENYLESGLPLEREENVGQVRSLGLELSARATFEGVSFFANATLLDARNLGTGASLDRVAPLIVNGGVQLTAPVLHTRVSVNARYTAARPRLDAQGFPRPEGPEPSLLWLDARLEQPVGKHLDVYLEAFNLTATRWDRDGDGDSDLPPLNLFVGLRARL